MFHICFRNSHLLFMQIKCFFFSQLFAISTVEVGYVFDQIFVCVKMDSTILAVCNLVMVFELHLLLE